MGICYDDESSVRPRYRGAVSTADPIRPYVTHYGNLLYLQFILRESTDRLEKRQAEKEVVICERKLAFWARQPQMLATEAANQVGALKAQWRAP